MKAKLLQGLNRIEAFSLRERLMLLLGLPLLLVALAEVLVFDPARKRATAAETDVVRLQKEIQSLNEVLAAQPAVAALPAVELLERQRGELQTQIGAARMLLAGADHAVDWSTVVRAAAGGSSNLALAQLKTTPAELVFAPSMLKAPPAAAARSGAAPASAPAAPTAVVVGRVDSLYRHRAEVSVKGDFSALLGYLQSLQQVPGDLRWDKLQLSVAAYPQASVQLSLYTLSTRPETPFSPPVPR